MPNHLKLIRPEHAPLGQPELAVPHRTPARIGGPPSSALTLPGLRRRPGDQREPFRVYVPDAFDRRANELALETSTAVALAYERRLLLDDSKSAGLSEAEAIAIFKVAAQQARPRQEGAKAMSSYFSALSSGTHRASSGEVGESLVPMPLRLYPRAKAIAPEAALVPAGLAEALSWEIAAVLERRTMLEWGLLSLLLHR
jgi:hypothetical protein